MSEEKDGVDWHQTIADKKICISPLPGGDQPGQVYEVAREPGFHGGLAVRCLGDGQVRWIREEDIEGFREDRDAGNFAGTLDLRWKLLIGGHGICYRKMYSHGFT